MLSKKHTKRPILLYPILFVADYLITKDIAVSDIPWLFVALLLLEASIIGGAYYLTKDIHRSGFVTILVMVWALYYGSVYYVLASYLGLETTLFFHLLFFVVWTFAFLCLASKYLWRRLGGGLSVTAYLNLLTVAAFLFFGYHVARIEMHKFVDSVGLPATVTAGTMTFSVRPDIYYIILDGYDRADMLEEMYGYDNSEFLSFLSSRGFYVANESQSNYMHTELSLASSLNMSYLQGLSTGPFTHSSGFKRLISDSRVRSTLKSMGYQLVAFSTPFYPTDITDADVYLSSSRHNARTTLLEAHLLPGSIAAIPLAAGLISPNGETYRDNQERVMYILDQMGRMPSLPGPRFVFAHILVPHPPCLFDRNGPVTPDKPYVLSLASAGGLRGGCAGQLDYFNPLVEQMIDAILERSTSLPIIVLQADHGSGLSEKACPKRRASILNAYFLPGLAHNPLYETISPVNSFRTILNQYFHAQLELLEDKVYSSGEGRFYEFVDVTENSKQSCQLP